MLCSLLHSMQRLSALNDRTAQGPVRILHAEAGLSVHIDSACNGSLTAKSRWHDSQSVVNPTCADIKASMVYAQTQLRCK